MPVYVLIRKKGLKGCLLFCGLIYCATFAGYKLKNEGLMIAEYGAALAAAGLVSYGLTRFLVTFLRKQGLIDVPNERSSHEVPTPRGGGLGILAGLTAGGLTAWAAGLPLPPAGLLIAVVLVGTVSFMDDRLTLPVFIRLVVQFGAVGYVLYAAYEGGRLPTELPFPEPLNVELSPFWQVLVAFVWMQSVMNFYNFLDGIDGFAGTQGLLAGAGTAVLLWGSGAGTTGLLVAGGCLGFLILNWHPAKIFMGDVGSVSLGMLFAGLPFFMPAETTVSEGIYYEAILLWFFLADGAFTIVRRGLKKERIWKPHRQHLYQRLTRTGVSHSLAVLLIMTPALLLTVVLYMEAENLLPGLTDKAVFVLAFVLFAGEAVMVSIREKRSSS